MMSVTEANAAQLLLRVVAIYQRNHPWPPQKALVEAGAVLAGKSHKVLMAGWSADEWRRQVGAA